MNCDEASGLLADRLKGLLGTEDMARLDRHLESCAACREEAAAVERLWQEMGEPENDVPSQRMRSRFHAAIAAYEERERAAESSLFDRWLRPPSFLLQAGMAAAVLVIGIVIGRGFPDTGGEIDELRREMRAMSVALLDHQSASERLLGVAWSARNDANAQVTDALLDVVRNDRNINVRLAAVEALGGWVDQPSVANALRDALFTEQVPLLQVALVELLLDRNVGDAAGVARELLESDSLDPTVREFVLSELEPGTASDTI